MKKVVMGFLALFVFAPVGWSEVIDSVLFDPSRLGRYKILKVSSELDASGGASVQTAVVKSHSSVTLNTPSGYKLTNVSAQKVNLPNTVFQTVTFQAAGGKASFGEGEIQSLKDSAQKMIRVKGQTVKVSEDVVLEMKGGKDYSNQKVRGLKLGGNDIPRPKAGCETLGWYVQKATNGKEYKVLGFKSCPEEEEECSASAKENCLGGGHDGTVGTWNDQTCECTCPEGYYFDEQEGVCEKDACTKTCGTGYRLNESTCECEKNTNPCDDASYKAAHECECDPDPQPGLKYCTQDEASAEGMVFDKNTCTCGCPAGQVMAKPDNTYWFCHDPAIPAATWQVKTAKLSRCDCGCQYSSCELPDDAYAHGSGAFSCDVSDIGKTCITQADGQIADGNWGINCTDTYRVTWECKENH